MKAAPSPLFPLGCVLLVAQAAKTFFPSFPPSLLTEALDEGEDVVVRLTSSESLRLCLDIPRFEPSAVLPVLEVRVCTIRLFGPLPREGS